MIGLIDYQAGNVRSVENAFKTLGAKVFLTKKPSDLSKADALILPGVGNFGDAMKELSRYTEAIIGEVSAGKPFLGLCLGIQIILDKSMEAKGVRGLGIVPGGSRKFTGNLKVPHMGWNSVDFKVKHPLFKGIKSGSYFYFVHSYYPKPADTGVVAGTTDYGIKFPSVIIKGNVMATQFHPEKSGEAGLRMLENFIDLI